MDLPLRLREAISVRHDSIERLPLTAAMAQGQLPRAAYARLLAQLLVVHETLESELSSVPQLAGLYRPEMARTVHLRHDLTVWGDGTEEVLPQTQRLVERIRHWAATVPMALIGCFYVFEGSRMGSMLLAKRLSASLGVPMEMGHGLNYHIDRMAERPALWGQFKAALQAAPFTEVEQDAIVQVAADTMDQVYAIYAAVMPVDEPVVNV